MNQLLISIVIPVYQEEKQIKKTLLATKQILLQHQIEHEFIIIDDGSKDNTWQELIKAAAEIPDIRAFKLSRNFGKEAALCAGLEQINGNACIVMDADLQHPPEIIPEMVRLWKEGYEIVEGTNRAYSIVGGRSIVRPYVQAFRLGRELKMTAPVYARYLLDQIKGNMATASPGFTLWDYSNSYYMVTQPLSTLIKGNQNNKDK